jgi:hypothetical protein
VNVLIIKEIIKDMKCDYDHAKKNIDKAMKYKEDRPSLAQEYYKRSVEDLNRINCLHDDIVEIITEYRDTKGDAPDYMENIWKWEHDNMIEGITEIKQLQDYYKSL